MVGLSGLPVLTALAPRPFRRSRPASRAGRAIFGLGAAVLTLFAYPLLAQGTGISEYAVKSALLFRLPQFVYRSESSRERPLTICLLGSNPFGSALERLAQYPVEGRDVRYVRLASVAEAGSCDFLFVSASEAPSLDDLLRRLAPLPVVTVSDIDGFARAGGMVELAQGHEGAAVSLLINRRAARRHNIQFSAQLLRLARVVEP